MSIAFQSILIIVVLFGLLFLLRRKVTKQNELYFNLAIALAATFTGVYLALNVDSYQKDKETIKRLISILESSQTLWKFEVAKYNWNHQRFREHPNHYKFISIFPQRPFQIFDPLNTILADGELYQKTSSGFRKYLPITIAQCAEIDTLLQGSSNIDSLFIEQNFEDAANRLEYLDDYVKNELQFLNGEKSEDSVNIYYKRIFESRTLFLQNWREIISQKIDNSKNQLEIHSRKIDSLRILINRFAKELPDSIRIPKTLYNKIFLFSDTSAIYPDSIIREILLYQKKHK